MQSKTIAVNERFSVVGAPVTVSGEPSNAALSDIRYVSSDPTVFLATPDGPGAVIEGVHVGKAFLTEFAVATEPDGSQGKILIQWEILVTPAVVLNTKAASLDLKFSPTIKGAVMANDLNSPMGSRPFPEGGRGANHPGMKDGVAVGMPSGGSEVSSPFTFSQAAGVSTASGPVGLQVTENLQDVEGKKPAFPTGTSAKA